MIMTLDPAAVDPRRAMSVVRRISLIITVVGLTAALLAPTGSAHDRRGPAVTELASFGDGSYTTGSTIGPDGALYVTDGSAGSVLRVDRRTGRVTHLCDGIADEGIRHRHRWTGRRRVRRPHGVRSRHAGQRRDLRAEPFGDPNAKNGIYRLERGGAFTLVADIGQWSIDNPPVPAIFIDTGVHYAMESYRGGFLVTDGHHNRVLWVSGRGSVKEVAAFGNVVPTGLEVTKGRAFITQAGPIPHEPEDGKVLVLGRRSGATEIASGASMLMDVERGPNGKLYALPRADGTVWPRARRRTRTPAGC